MGEHQIPPRFDHGAAYAQGVRSLATWRQIQEIAARCLAAHMRGERVVLTANGVVLAEIDPPQTMSKRSPGSSEDLMKPMDKNDEFGARLLGASVGDVDRRQGGILPTGGLQITNEMIHRAQTEAARWDNPLGASAIRAMLEAALRG